MKRCLLKRASPDARSSAAAPASSADGRKRNRATLEEAFTTAEAESLLDGTTPSEDYIVTKKLVLSGVVTLDQAIRELKARYTGPRPQLERSLSGLPCLPSTGSVITSEMVRESEEECDLIDANPEAFYKRQLEDSCLQAAQEGTMTGLKELLRLCVGAVAPAKRS